MEKNYGQLPSKCIKIVLFGPESTGKTTLAMQLAEFYNTEWVPEFSRIYLQELWNSKKQICSLEDIPIIAQGQIDFENKYAQLTNSLLFCDTNLLETKVYSEVYFNGYCDSVVKKYALENSYDLYFLTYIDTIWEADDLRDKPNEREMMFETFHQELIKHKKPYFILRGSENERFKSAIKIIEEFIIIKKKSDVAG